MSDAFVVGEAGPYSLVAVGRDGSLVFVRSTADEVHLLLTDQAALDAAS